MKKKFVVVFNDGYGFQGILKEGHEEPHNRDDYLEESEYMKLFDMSSDFIWDWNSRGHTNQDTLEMIREECPQYEFEDYIIV